MFGTEQIDVLRHRLYTDTKRLLVLVHREQLPFLAAAISYYAFVSLVPLFLVALAVGTAVAGETVGRQIVTATSEVLTPETTELLEAALAADAGRGSATAVGLLALLWSGLRVFRGIDVAVSRIYGEPESKPFLRQIRDALLVLGALGLAAGTVTAGTTVFGTSVSPVPGTLGAVGVGAVLSIVLFPIYKRKQREYHGPPCPWVKRVTRRTFNR